MEYRSFCDNKGCHKEMRPVVNKETLEAFCTECGNQVNNISIFMRRQMASYDQVQRNEKKRMPWSMMCKSCNKEGPPELDKDGKKLNCSFCGKELENVARPFYEMVRTNLIAQRRADGG
jgi:ribosomal protein L34E